jgi:glyoxylase-like metal-dependent hydrolase (beta-lactamase superfamily II)
MGREVYALRLAQRAPVPGGSAFYRRLPGDIAPAMDFFIWAIVDDGQVIVVDTGFTAATAARRSAPDVVLETVASVLGAAGIVAAQVDTVVLTHLHYDHAGDTAAFPNARFVIQDRELAFWTGRYGWRPGMVWTIEPQDVLDVVALSFAGRLSFVDGDAALTNGISVHLVGGHSPGLQVVRVQTDNGIVLIASDAVHYYANFERDRPFAIQHSVPDAHAAFDRVRELAGPRGTVVPGHDPLVRERHPPAAFGLAGRVIRIA